jgi:hypothetical protein
MTLATPRRFYRTIKSATPTRADFLSDEARGVDPPDNPVFRRYWQGLSVFDTLAHARAVAQRYRRQGDYIAEVTIARSGYNDGAMGTQSRPPHTMGRSR